MRILNKIFILDEIFKYLILLLQSNSKLYHVRIAAYCENPTGRYNYTDVVKIQM